MGGPRGQREEKETETEGMMGEKEEELDAGVTRRANGKRISNVKASRKVYKSRQDNRL